jgi:hypothetical protein
VSTLDLAAAADYLGLHPDTLRERAAALNSAQGLLAAIDAGRKG